MRAISIDKVNNIKSLLMSTKSNSKIVKQARVSRTTVQKYRVALPVVRNVNKAGGKSLIGERLISLCQATKAFAKSSKHQEATSMGRRTQGLDRG
ncbi:hypothetical protein G6F51_014255 [Rhizopus arrhizus]|uniref:Uncharacterized protein n=1 Tax=Rhizopus oryzae TaxID=64495 RepID=A0A9P7BYN0_RHIOR|nr:hypothetical protein G6F51_014255 [Rhizopus arrhizus]